MSTPEQQAVLIAALEVAIYPHTHESRGADALVSWRRIDALRAALEAAGIDWRAVKAEQALRDAAVG